MEYYAGIDVSLECSSVCVVDATGRVAREGKVASEPEALIGWLGALGLGLAQIGLEAGPLSQWLFAELRKAGLAVELLETRHVRDAFKAMPVKTDRNDARGIAQLIRLFPTGSFRPIRGNLDTRLRKLDQGDVDAIVLAAAGLRRLEQAGRITALVPADACVPAPGQGIVAVETRVDDAATAALVARINDADALDALHAERAVVAALGGGCQMPIGAHAAIRGDRITLTGVVIAPDGSRAARAAAEGLRSQAAAVGREAASRLLAGGADDILARIRAADHAGSSRT